MTEPRPVPPRVLLALAAAVVLLIGTVAVVHAVRGTPATRGVHAGLLLTGDADLGQGETHPVAFALPVGSLQVAVGDPTEEASSFGAAPGLDDDSGRLHSGPTRRFVPVTWSLGELDGVLAGTPDYGYRVVLVADGRRYDLHSDDADTDEPSAYGYSGSVVAVVDGHPDLADLGIEVTYDGLTQTGDVATGAVDAGEAAQLATPTRYAPTRTCSFVVSGLDGAARRAGDLVPSPTCTVGVLASTPYVAGLGWAPGDRPWLVAHVSLTLPIGLGLPHDEVDLRRAPITLRLDGRRPAQTLSAYDDPTAFDTTVVFDGSARPRRLVVDARLTGTLRGRPVTVALPTLPLRLVS